MEDHKLGAMETRFAELIWVHAPIASGELVKICQKELEWKKSTTYTMLRRLCQRGIFKIKADWSLPFYPEKNFKRFKARSLSRIRFRVPCRPFSPPLPGARS